MLSSQPYWRATLIFTVPLLVYLPINSIISDYVFPISTQNRLKHFQINRQNPQIQTSNSNEKAHTTKTY